jgi:hypothetical protein
LSATIQMFFTYEAGVIGALTSMLTGTTAPFSAIGGMSPPEDALQPILDGFLKPERLRRRLRVRAGAHAQRPGRHGHADGAQPAERRATSDRLCHASPCPSPYYYDSLGSPTAPGGKRTDRA